MFIWRLITYACFIVGIHSCFFEYEYMGEVQGDIAVSRQITNRTKDNIFRFKFKDSDGYVFNGELIETVRPSKNHSYQISQLLNEKKYYEPKRNKAGLMSCIGMFSLFALIIVYSNCYESDGISIATPGSIIIYLNQWLFKDLVPVTETVFSTRWDIFKSECKNKIKKFFGH